MYSVAASGGSPAEPAHNACREGSSLRRTTVCAWISASFAVSRSTSAASPLRCACRRLTCRMPSTGFSGDASPHRARRSGVHGSARGWRSPSPRTGRGSMRATPWTRSRARHDRTRPARASRRSRPAYLLSHEWPMVSVSPEQLRERGPEHRGPVVGGDIRDVVVDVVIETAWRPDVDAACSVLAFVGLASDDQRQPCLPTLLEHGSLPCSSAPRVRRVPRRARAQAEGVQSTRAVGSGGGASCSRIAPGAAGDCAAGHKVVGGEQPRGCVDRTRCVRA